MSRSKLKERSGRATRAIRRQGIGGTADGILGSVLIEQGEHDMRRAVRDRDIGIAARRAGAGDAADRRSA